MAKPIVALVGRPNVGKSTLFNRVIGERVAIVEDIAGTTRDRLYYEADWNGRVFTIVDTGGMEIEPGSDIAQRVRGQAEAAIAEADVIVFIVDARQGLVPGDEEVARILRQTSKPVILVANKADTARERQNISEFYQLGLPSFFSISAMHGTGTGDLLDAIVERLPPAVPEPEEDEATVRVAIVGRPNVGKSSLLNAIVGEERTIVADLPGTTRDAIDTEVEFEGHEIILIDTAGVRRRGRIERGVEQYSVIRAIRAIERADVVVLVIDGSEGVTAQDTHLAGYAISEAKGLVIAINKRDLLPRGQEVYDEFTAQVREDFKFAPFAPLLFVSARDRWHVDDVLRVALDIAASRRRRIPTATFNALISEAVDAHGPSHDRGRSLKILYATQVAINPPTFVFFVNDPTLLHFSYERYLENRIRQAFGFEGTAIKLIFRAREPREIERERGPAPRPPPTPARGARPPPPPARRAVVTSSREYWRAASERSISGSVSRHSPAFGSRGGAEVTTMSAIVGGVAIVLAGYLMGAIPMGFLITRWRRGIDIRRVGSGSTGTTNVARVLGWRWSAVVFVLDLLKSSLPVVIALLLTGDAWIESATGVAVVAGHCWSIFAGWSGGKGSTSSFAALLVIQPLAALGSFVVAAVVAGVSRFASLGSILGTSFGAIVMVVLLVGHAIPTGDVIFIVGSPLIVFIRHRENFRRLLAGRERRIGDVSGHGGQRTAT